jgi:YbbR domain-containing protein
MIKAFRSLVSNIATLLLAFVVATIIWINASQVEEPSQRLPLQIPINVVGIPENGIVIKPDLQTLQDVQISYEGPESIVEQLTIENFSATLDLSQVPFGEETFVAVDVQINSAEDINLVFQSIEFVAVLIEQSVSRDIPVELDIRGSVARGHTQGAPLIDPPFITITGPASSVEQLSDIRATIFLNNAREAQVFVPQLILYDREGRVASSRNLSLSAEEVSVTIPINESAGFTEKFIRVERIGEPADGYRLLNVTVEPASVFVTGRPTQLAILPQQIKTEPIDVTGLTESTQLPATLDLPDGVGLDQDQAIFVIIEIEPRLDTSSFRRDIEILGLGEGLEVIKLTPEDVRAILFGPVLALNALQEDDVRVTVDLFDLGEGTYSVEPKVIFPERGIELRSVQPSAVTVEIAPIPIVTDTITSTLSITETQNMTDTNAMALPGSVKAVFLPIPFATLTTLSYYSPFAYLYRREKI